MWWLLGVALAQDIQPVAPGQTVTAQVQSYLLPEAKYDRCLVAAKNLPTCQQALASCTQAGEDSFDLMQGALNSCVEQSRSDELLIDKQVLTIQDLETGKLLAERQGQKWKHQRDLALVTAGTLLLSTSAVTVAMIYAR